MKIYVYYSYFECMLSVQRFTYPFLRRCVMSKYVLVDPLPLMNTDNTKPQCKILHILLDLDLLYLCQSHTLPPSGLETERHGTTFGKCLPCFELPFI